jgi:hypothetical protein
MTTLTSTLLACSGALIASSIILARIGLSREFLSRSEASLLGGAGTAVGMGMFIFYGISNADLAGSIITGAIAGITVAVVILIPTRWWR